MEQRLDKALVEKQLLRSRTRAQKIIKEGGVRVNGHVQKRTSFLVNIHDILEVTDDDRYVSRSAYKLKEALEVFSDNSSHHLKIKNKICLDVGASTGGFTQVLLEEGARSVVAVDVGQDQMDLSVKNDTRVYSYEKLNARDMFPQTLGVTAEFVVCDVSFISLTLLMDNIAQCTVSGGDILLMVKPQFELGYRHKFSQGVVNKEKYRQEALNFVLIAAKNKGLIYVDKSENTTFGQYGNQEIFIWLKKK